VAETSDVPLRVDAIQYELASGPCVDAIIDNTTYHCPDLAEERRWPEFGRRAVAEAGVRSMLSFRMFLEDDDLIAGLNFYATDVDAFDENAVTTGLLLATHGALALSALRRGDTASHLARALESNREIGVAMGVLMSQHKITRGRPGAFKTVAETSEVPLRVDAIQYELGYGPCVDAIVDNTTYHCPDLAEEQRWPEFGPRAVAEAGVHSMLSFRMFLEDEDLIAGLNFYASTVDAFDENAVTTGLLLATHGALALSALRRGDTAAQLARALESNREIGVAMGVLMSQHRITRDQAFNLLRITSQHTHRKLSQVAADVADTGTLELPKLQ
jgi:AmiR/NasT family two-component response regulator